MAIYFGETPKERFNKKATLTLDFTKNLYKDSNNFSIAPKSFSEVFSFTRGSTKTGTTKVGLRTAGSNTPVENEWNPVTNNFEGLSIHEQRTNLLLWSEDFTNVFWFKSASINITPNASAGADGKQTADKVSRISTEGTASLATTGVFPAGIHTLSVDIEPIDSDEMQIAAGDFVADVNVLTGTYTIRTTGSDINLISLNVEPINLNRFRVSATLDNTSGVAKNLGFLLRPPEALQDYFYIWGAQLEQGSFITPYIPTTTAQVTRQADVCSIDNIDHSDWWNPNEGTFVVEFESASSPYGATTIIADTFNSTIRFFPINGVLHLQDGVSLYSTGLLVEEKNMLAIRLSDSGTSCSLNGSAVSNMPSENIAQLIQGLSLGVRSNLLNYLNGTIKTIKYKPAAVSDTELQELSKL